MTPISLNTVDGISIHAPREGSDGGLRQLLGQPWHFYPRSPRGERLLLAGCRLCGCKFLSTLPARGATTGGRKKRVTGPISIHAPREGSDVQLRHRHGKRPISIHAPREGSDFWYWSIEYRPSSFLSTLPARGATVPAGCGGKTRKISIHAPREGSDQALEDLDVVMPISIHAPREGSDWTPSARRLRTRYFYPRSPRGERLRFYVRRAYVSCISIHAPREGSDWAVDKARPRVEIISIHAPREGSDAEAQNYKKTLLISIHAPREGSDGRHRGRRPVRHHFYPRSPRGERPK